MFCLGQASTRSVPCAGSQLLRRACRNRCRVAAEQMFSPCWANHFSFGVKESNQRKRASALRRSVLIGHISMPSLARLEPLSPARTSMAGLFASAASNARKARNRTVRFRREWFLRAEIRARRSQVMTQRDAIQALSRPASAVSQSTKWRVSLRCAAPSSTMA